MRADQGVAGDVVELLQAVEDEVLVAGASGIAVLAVVGLAIGPMITLTILNQNPQKTINQLAPGVKQWRTGTLRQTTGQAL